MSGRSQNIRRIGLGISYDLMLILIAISPFVAVFLSLVLKKFNPVASSLLVLLIGGAGASLGVGISLHFSPPTLLALAVTGFPLAAFLLLHPVIEYRWLLKKYKKSEERLIQP